MYFALFPEKVNTPPKSRKSTRPTEAEESAEPYGTREYCSSNLGLHRGMTYDERGHKLSETNANNKTTTWGYDYMGRMIRHTLPLGQSETFAVHSRNPVSAYNPLARLERFERPTLGSVVRKAGTRRALQTIEKEQKTQTLPELAVIAISRFVTAYHIFNDLRVNHVSTRMPIILSISSGSVGYGGTNLR